MGRYVVAIGLAGLVTFGLFWVMQALISVAAELLEGRPSPVVDFVRLKRDFTPEAKKREVPKRTPPEAPPPPPEIDVSQDLDPDDAVGDIDLFMDNTLELSEATDLSGGGADRDVVPLVRVEPQYPMRAAQRQQEGWVELMFTISSAGTVKDAVVTASQPRKVFDKAALQAVRKWKYNAKVENGRAVERPGIRVRLTFELDS